MISCKNCNSPMEGVMSFSKEKNEKFFRCKKCNAETRHQRIKNDELDFGEVLDKELHKRK